MSNVDELVGRIDGMIASAEEKRDQFGVDQSHSWAQMQGRYEALCEIRALLAQLEDK